MTTVLQTTFSVSLTKRACKLISPLVGEMPGRAEGGSIANGIRPRHPPTRQTASKSSTSFSEVGRVWQASVKPASTSQGSSE